MQRYTLLVKAPAARAVRLASARGLRVDVYAVHTHYEHETVLTVQGEHQVVADWFCEDAHACVRERGYPVGSLLHYREEEDVRCAVA